MFTTWVVAVLSLSLPPDYALVGNTSERIARQGPPGLYAAEEFRSWQAPGGKNLYLFYWQPAPPRDLGPMAIASQQPVTVAGQQTAIVETSMFMGRQQKVLVTYLKFADPEARAMIYADGLTVAEFEALLGRIVVTGK